MAKNKDLKGSINTAFSNKALDSAGRTLHSRKHGMKNNFLFSSVLKRAISDLPERSQEIIKMRFGISGEKPQTLEAIGNRYQVSRERVRQIIKEIIKRTKHEKNRVFLDPAFQKIKFTIKQNNGIISRKELLNELSRDPKEQGVVEFMLNCTDEIKPKKEKGKLKDSIALADFNFNRWKETVEQLKSMLEEEKEVFKSGHFFKKSLSRGIKEDKKEFFCYLSVSEEIKKNNFGKWGLSWWSEIDPKGTRERAFLVMKEAKKPLHYREVADLIGQYKLSEKNVHPQTVHNELIKDDCFVLVGRGKYALSEWGYKKGTVKDVLREVLNENGKPMERGDIVGKVLSLRDVKASTVVVNLNNFFERVGENEYTIK